MILALHNLAEAYKVLPSEALVRASTFDLYVLDCHYKYVKYQNEKAQGSDAPKPPRKLSQQEMQAMINRVRSKEKATTGA